MKLLPRTDRDATHRTLRAGDVTLTSTRRADGTIVIQAGHQRQDGSWWWTDEPDFLR